MTTALAVLRPKDLGNFRAAAAATLLLVAVYAAGSLLWPFSPKRGVGLGFGFLAALLFGFEMLYASRRPGARPLGTARNYLQAHVYLGGLAFVAVLLHSGLAWPSGGVGFFLLFLSAWTTLSGIAGVALQKWVPAALADGLKVEALYERIPALVAELRAEADELARESGQVVAAFYAKEVRPRLGRLSPSWGYLLDVRRGRERAVEPFRSLTRFVDPSDKETVEDLMAIYIEKLELDAHWTLQGLLRRWTLVHVPPAALLLAFILIHLFSWVWY
jgi:hypothetical protein